MGHLSFLCLRQCVLLTSGLPFLPRDHWALLEEIDLIFAKGYSENMNYVKAARDLPRLSDEDVERVAIQYSFGPANSDSSGDSSGGATQEHTQVDTEKSTFTQSSQV